MNIHTLSIPSLNITCTGDAMDIAHKIADNCNPFADRVKLVTEIILSTNVIITVSGVDCIVKRK